MNRTQLTSLVVALACFGAVGVSASTLSSSVAADPSDALDPDYEVIPVAGDGLDQLESAVAGDGAPEPGTGHGPDSQAKDQGRSDQKRQERDSSDGDESENADNGEGDTENSAGGDGDGRSNSDGGDGTARVPGERFTLMDLLTLLVLVALVAGTAWLCYRYRDRFRALFATDEPQTDDDPHPIPDGPPADDNLVFEAWDDLRTDLDVDRPETLTTRECAQVATASGFDRDDIERLRLDFEAVRYGGQPVTDDRRRRARSVRKRLGLNGESP